MYEGEGREITADECRKEFPACECRKEFPATPKWQIVNGGCKNI